MADLVKRIAAWIRRPCAAELDMRAILRRAAIDPGACRNCRFWKRGPAYSQRGECRRLPPPNDLGWPRTDMHGSCGEHQRIGTGGRP
ncbi:hypothetical protein [Ancylobacter mangrovi]|uniref:hypothetical protein n=1 Tax=Ancylobacter mangrovi TaxID=2972472 RepID=UPI0021613BD6|nr:hypothetical protein [Ancylobacter mangrovi]MCS0501576.1 hypothetical protein [Ancylobacter mangrovi]